MLRQCAVGNPPSAETGPATVNWLERQLEQTESQYKDDMYGLRAAVTGNKSGSADRLRILYLDPKLMNLCGLKSAAVVLSACNDQGGEIHFPSCGQSGMNARALYKLWYDFITEAAAANRRIALKCEVASDTEDPILPVFDDDWPLASDDKDKPLRARFQFDIYRIEIDTAKERFKCSWKYFTFRQLRKKQHILMRQFIGWDPMPVEKREKKRVTAACGLFTTDKVIFRWVSLDWKDPDNPLKDQEGIERDTDHINFHPVNEIERVGTNEWNEKMRHTNIFHFQNWNGVARVSDLCVVEGVSWFSEKLELHNFPFDSQNFTIDFRQWSRETLLLPLTPLHETSAMVVSFAGLPTSDFQFCGQSIEMAPGADNEGRPVTDIFVSLKFKRCAAPYLWEVVFFNSLVSILGMGCFVSDPLDNYHDRMEYNITLFLVIIAFKFVLKDRLPTLDYLTWLDKFVMASASFIFSLCVETTVAHFLALQADNKGNEYSETPLIVSSMCIYALGNLAFLVEAQRQLKDERNKLNLPVTKTDRKRGGFSGKGQTLAAVWQNTGVLSQETCEAFTESALKALQLNTGEGGASHYAFTKPLAMIQMFKNNRPR